MSKRCRPKHITGSRSKDYGREKGAACTGWLERWRMRVVTMLLVMCRRFQHFASQQTTLVHAMSHAIGDKVGVKQRAPCSPGTEQPMSVGNKEEGRPSSACAGAPPKVMKGARPRLPLQQRFMMPTEDSAARESLRSLPPVLFYPVFKCPSVMNHHQNANQDPTRGRCASDKAPAAMA